MNSAVRHQMSNWVVQLAPECFPLPQQKSHASAEHRKQTNSWSKTQLQWKCLIILHSKICFIEHTIHNGIGRQLPFYFVEGSIEIIKERVVDPVVSSFHCQNGDFSIEMHIHASINTRLGWDSRHVVFSVCSKKGDGWLTKVLFVYVLIYILIWNNLWHALMWKTG